MELPGGILSPFWMGVGWATTGLALTSAAWRLAKNIRQCRFPLETLFSPWLGAGVALLAFGLMAFEAQYGLRLHLLGAGVLTLMFGPEPALLGLAAVAVAIAANGSTGWAMLGPSFLVGALVPVLVMEGWRRGVARLLPHQLFVYLFANGFFGAAASLLFAGLAATALVATGGSAAPLAALAEAWMPSLLLLSFSEAWLSGMILTLLVVYRPAWVISFDRREYLSNK